MIRYFEIVIRSVLRLLAILIVLPLAFGAIDLYLQRSYDATATVSVDDPSSFGANAESAVGYNPYLTPSQNAVIGFSNLMGTETFNNSVADVVAAQGLINSPKERTALIASLASLSISPGAPLAGGSGGGSGFSSNLTISFHYTCTRVVLCGPVINAALEVLKSEWSDLKARGTAAALAIYQANLKTAQADLAAALAALQKYDAQHQKPANQSGQSTAQDPVRQGLQHDVDVAQRVSDQVGTQIDTLSTYGQIPTAMAKDMVVIDGPRVDKGLFGISGMRKDNLKADGIALTICIVAAAAYIIFVAFFDRTVRDPDEIQRRLAKQVVVIPDYQPKRWTFWKKRAAT